MTPSKKEDFPQLLPLREAVWWISHRSIDHNDINGMYYTREEREYAEGEGFKIMCYHASNKELRATGRLSITKNNKIHDDWRKQTYKGHNGFREWIPSLLWRNSYVKYDWDGSAKVNFEDRQYVDAMVVVDDLTSLYPNTRPPNEEDEVIDEGGYVAPYVELMLEAIRHFQITNTNQPLKKHLEDWFLEQKVDGPPISAHQAKLMATFVRLPSSQSGGNRPHDVHRQQLQKANTDRS